MSEQTHPSFVWRKEKCSFTLSTSLLLIWLCSNLYLKITGIILPFSAAWIIVDVTWCCKAGPASQSAPPLDSPPCFHRCSHLLRSQDCAPWASSPLDWKDWQPPLMAEPLAHLTSAQAPPLLSDVPSSCLHLSTSSKTRFPCHLQSSPISPQPFPAFLLKLPTTPSKPEAGEVSLWLRRIRLAGRQPAVQPLLSRPDIAPPPQPPVKHHRTIKMAKSFTLSHFLLSSFRITSGCSQNHKMSIKKPQPKYEDFSERGKE